MRTWIMATRPKTLAASIAPVLMGAALVMKNGSANLTILLFTLLTAIGIQICINLTNDLFDYTSGRDTSERIGPTRVTQAGLVEVKTMKKVVIGAYLVTALIGIPLIVQGGLVAAIILAIALLCAFAYTAGPFPIAQKGLSELFVLIFYGPVSVAGTCYLQTGTWQLLPLIIGIAPACLSVGILTMNDLRDYALDKKNGKRTLIVRLGPTYGKIQYVLALLLPLVTIFFAGQIKPHLYLLSSYLLIALHLIKQVLSAQNPRQLIPLLEKTGALTLLFSFAFVVLWML